MRFELFINFDGDCRQAVEFYAQVFRSEVKNLMTYGQSPDAPQLTLTEADKDRVCYADVRIGDKDIMFMDMPAGMPLAKGNNITPTLNLTDKQEVERVFNELKEGGQVLMQLQKTFYSDLYGMLTDRFGIVWHVMHHVPS